MFSGSLVALVTPFRDGRLDVAALVDLIEFQIQNGTSGLVMCGTTGESPTLTREEQDEVISITVERAKGRVPVIAGTGTYNTEESIRRTKDAASRGAAGVMIVTPYYNRPTPRGLRRHFLAIADESPVPILLYNIPSRTGTRIPTELVVELAKHPKILAIKEATGSPADAMEILESGVIDVLAGDDAVVLPWMAMGACGVVSVAGNVVPREMSALVEAAAKGDFLSARAMHYRLLPLFRALFLESNPVPVKALLGVLKRCSPEVRSPLIEAEPKTIQALVAAYGMVGASGKAVASAR